MPGLVEYELREDVAVITLQNPPANALTPEVRRALDRALDQAEQDDYCDAVVLCATGPGFPAGPDIRELDGEEAQPTLRQLAATIEDLSKPVIAALHGAVVGPGFELALAARARVVAQGTKVGLGDIRLGLPPRAGATQRLPRLVDVQDALKLLLEGKSLSAQEALSCEVIDHVVMSDLLVEAVPFARAIAADPPRRAKDRRDRFVAGFSYQEATQATRAAPGVTPDGVAGRIIDCIEAAQVLPFEAGQGLEQAAFEDLKDTPVAVARRHGFVAQQLAFQRPAAARGPSPLRAVALIGSGPDVVAPTLACLAAGLWVTVVTLEARTVQATDAAIRAQIERQVAFGQTKAGAISSALDSWQVIADISQVGQVEVVADLGAAETLYARAATVSQHMSNWAVLCVTQPGADLAQLAKITGLSDRLGVVHRINKGVAEWAAPDAATQQTQSALFHFAVTQSRNTARVPAQPGLIAQPLVAAMVLAVDHAVAMGANPYDADLAIMRGPGFGLSPYAALDRFGLDPDMGPLRQSGFKDGFSHVIAASGRLGKASGRGVYAYQGKTPERDPLVLEIHRAYQVERGITPAPCDPEALRNWMNLALANMGASLIGSQRCQSHGDVDVFAVLGLGYPHDLGGPMHWAQTKGLLSVQRQLETLAHINAVWTPAPALKAAVLNGNKFSVLEFGAGR